MLWRCEFSLLGHGIFWWNTGSPQQGYIILPSALSLVSRVTEVHHMFKDPTGKHLNSWGEEGEANGKESGSLCHLLSTRHSTVYLPRDGRRMKRWERQKQRKLEKWPTSPHTLSVDGPSAVELSPRDGFGWWWLCVGCQDVVRHRRSSSVALSLSQFMGFWRFASWQTVRQHSITRKKFTSCPVNICCWFVCFSSVMRFLSAFLVLAIYYS